MIHPYGVIRNVDEASFTFLAVESREETLASWYDGTATAIFAVVDDNGTERVGLNNALSRDPSMMTYATFGNSESMNWGPSSEHPGVATHSFADGSARSIADDISIDVFRAIVTRASDDNGPIAAYLSGN